MVKGDWRYIAVRRALMSLATIWAWHDAGRAVGAALILVWLMFEWVGQVLVSVMLRVVQIEQHVRQLREDVEDHMSRRR